MVYMHIILLGALTVLLLGGAVVAVICFFCSYDSEGKKKSVLGFLPCLLLGVPGLAWWVHACNQPWEPAHQSFHEIKVVEWPDGTKAQMFTCDNQHYNVTEMFGKFVDEKEWRVRRVMWKSVYAGVSFSGTSNTGPRPGYPSFYLERVDGKSSFDLKTKQPEKQ